MLLVNEFGQVFKQTVRSVPIWIFEIPFKQACARTSSRDAVEYARRFQRMRRHVIAKAAMEAGSGSTHNDDARLGVAENVVIERAVAIARLSFGALLEDYSALLALRITPVTNVPTSLHVVSTFSRICTDGYFIALWTDTNSCYINNILNTDLEQTVGTYSVQLGCSLGSPNIKQTSSVSALPSVAIAFQHLLSGKTPTNDKCNILTLLLHRCIQSGSRGWDGALNNAMANEYTRNVCKSVVTMSLVGMHQQLHPAARPKWESRLVISSIMQSAAASKHIATILKKCTVATKECMRLYMCSIMEELPATSTALNHSKHAIGGLRCCPNGMAPTSLQAAAHCMVSAGLDIMEVVNQHREDLRTTQSTTLSDSFVAIVTDCITTNIGAEPRSRKRSQLKPRESHSIVLPSVVAETSKLSYSSSWLNRISYPESLSSVEKQNGRRKRNVEHCQQQASSSAAAECVPEQPKTDTVPSVTEVVQELMMKSFKARFIPFWNHSHSNGIRSARFDEPQYNEMHKNAPSHLMAVHMDEREMLRVQRLALMNTNSSIMGVADAVSLIGRSTDETKSRLRASTSIDDSIELILDMTENEVAALLHFAKIASLKETMLAYDLGPRERKRQLFALSRRFDLDYKSLSETGVVQALPPHATKLFWCLECNSVSNACVCLHAKELAHNEVGVSQTMLHIGGIDEPSEVRCAKRSSAALRTALQKESDACSSRAESIVVDEEKLSGSLTENTEASHAARLRRDIKACSEQGPYASACGDRAMVKVDILGKVTRISGKWYSICALCGSIFVVDNTKRYNSFLCCCRCDIKMLGIRGNVFASASTRRGQAVPVQECTNVFAIHVQPHKLPCRFCGKAAPASTNSKFKIIRAPLDDGGRNAMIPPPLRIVAYCPSHYRNWLSWASLELETKIIFSHIAEKAVPTYGADSTKRVNDTSPPIELKRHFQPPGKAFKRLTKKLKRKNGKC